MITQADEKDQRKNLEVSSEILYFVCKSRRQFMRKTMFKKFGGAARCCADRPTITLNNPRKAENKFMKNEVLHNEIQ